MMHHRSSGCSISMSDRLWYSCIEWLFFTAERKSLADYTAAIIYGRVINGVNAGFPVLNGVQVGFNFSGHVGGCSFLLPRGRGGGGAGQGFYIAVLNRDPHSMASGRERYFVVGMKGEAMRQGGAENNLIEWVSLPFPHGKTQWAGSVPVTGLRMNSR